MTTMKDVKKAVEQLDDVQALLLEQGERIVELQLDLDRYIDSLKEADERIEMLVAETRTFESLIQLQAAEVEMLKGVLNRG